MHGKQGRSLDCITDISPGKPLLGSNHEQPAEKQACAFKYKGVIAPTMNGVFIASSVITMGLGIASKYCKDSGPYPTLRNITAGVNAFCLLLVFSKASYDAWLRMKKNKTTDAIPNTNQKPITNGQIVIFCLPELAANGIQYYFNDHFRGWRGLFILAMEDLATFFGVLGMTKEDIAPLLGALDNMIVAVMLRFSKETNLSSIFEFLAEALTGAIAGFIGGLFVIYIATKMKTLSKQSMLPFCIGFSILRSGIMEIIRTGFLYTLNAPEYNDYWRELLVALIQNCISGIMAGLIFGPAFGILFKKETRNDVETPTMENQQDTQNAFSNFQRIFAVCLFGQGPQALMALSEVVLNPLVTSWVTSWFPQESSNGTNVTNTTSSINNSVNFSLPSR